TRTWRSRSRGAVTCSRPDGSASRIAPTPCSPTKRCARPISEADARDWLDRSTRGDGKSYGSSSAQVPVESTGAHRFIVRNEFEPFISHGPRLALVPVLHSLIEAAEWVEFSITQLTRGPFDVGGFHLLLLPHLALRPARRKTMKSLFIRFI